MAAPPCPNHNFADTIRRIDFAFGILRCESLVRMFMSGKNQISVRRIQVFPYLLQLRMNGVLLEDPAAEQSLI